MVWRPTVKSWPLARKTFRALATVSGAMSRPALKQEKGAFVCEASCIKNKQTKTQTKTNFKAVFKTWFVPRFSLV